VSQPPDPPAAPRERADAARNRRRVLDAAAALFAERDPATVTMEDIARRAGVGKATLYRRYPDRTAIAAALLDGHERDLQERLLRGPAPLGPGAPPGERLAAFLIALADLLEAHGHLSLAIETEAQRLATGAHAAWRAHVQHLLDEAAGTAATHTALADQLLAAVSPSLYRHQRETLGLTRGDIHAALGLLAHRVAGAVAP
jgi:AcrR family transcriptional regulator